MADSFIAPEVVINFCNKLEEVGVDWEMNTYGGVGHGFTNPDAEKFETLDLVYDKRSWARMQEFFWEVFE